MTFKFELMDTWKKSTAISGLITAAEREAGNAKELREDNADYSAEPTLNAIP